MWRYRKRYREKEKTPSLKNSIDASQSHGAPFWSFQCIVYFPSPPFFNDDDVCAPKCQPSKKKYFPNPSNEIRNWPVWPVPSFGKCNRWMMTKALSLAEFAHIYNKQSNKQKMKISKRMNDQACASVNKHKAPCYLVIWARRDFQPCVYAHIPCPWTHRQLVF